MCYIPKKKKKNLKNLASKFLFNSFRVTGEKFHQCSFCLYSNNKECLYLYSSHEKREAIPVEKEKKHQTIKCKWWKSPAGSAHLSNTLSCTPASIHLPHIIVNSIIIIQFPWLLIRSSSCYSRSRHAKTSLMPRPIGVHATGRRNKSVQNEHGQKLNKYIDE